VRFESEFTTISMFRLISRKLMQSGLILVLVQDCVNCQDTVRFIMKKSINSAESDEEIDSVCQYLCNVLA